MEALEIRTHNAKAFLAQLQGGKMEMINPDMRALERQISRQHAKQEGA